MYFVVIVAFALLLADGLPPAALNILPLDLADPVSLAGATRSTVGLACGLTALVALCATIVNRLALRAVDGTPDGLDTAQERYTWGGFVVLGLLGASLGLLFVFTPWPLLVRRVWELDDFLLLADLVLLAPFLASLVLAWLMLYPTDRVIRSAGMQQRVDDGAAPRPIWGPGTYLLYKLRHQVFVIAVPMMMVLLAKHLIEPHRERIAAFTHVWWAPDALMGVAVAFTLLLAPLFVRFIWATRSLPPGELRSRLEAQCRRMRLRHRDILVWDSQGLIVNAAVMGFVAPLRYVMLSDGLIETMSPRQIEAVFAHEAGHVRHHHLQFFVVFATLSMLVVGGFLEVLIRVAPIGPGLLQLLAMATTLAVWGAGFGWVSRHFERQADVFGVRAITPDVELCSADCAVHGGDASGLASAPEARGGLCLSAARIFGNTLHRIADLNGIPRDAPSWRHGSIHSRCRLLESLADQPAAVRRFDRRLWRIKAGMVGLTVVGLSIAAWLYWPAELARRVFGG